MRPSAVKSRSVRASDLNSRSLQLFQALGMFQAQAKKWSSQQRERKEVSGAPGEIRTPDPLVRSQMLYPAELRAREAILPKIAGGAGSARGERKELWVCSLDRRRFAELL